MQSELWAILSICLLIQKPAINQSSQDILINLSYFASVAHRIQENACLLALFNNATKNADEEMRGVMYEEQKLTVSMTFLRAQIFGGLQMFT